MLFYFKSYDEEGTERKAHREPPYAERRQQISRQPMASELKDSKDVPVGSFRLAALRHRA